MKWALIAVFALFSLSAQAESFIREFPYCYEGTVTVKDTAGRVLKTSNAYLELGGQGQGMKGEPIYYVRVFSFADETQVSSGSLPVANVLRFYDGNGYPGENPTIERHLELAFTEKGATGTYIVQKSQDGSNQLKPVEIGEFKLSLCRWTKTRVNLR